MIGFLGCEPTLLGHIRGCIHQYPWILCKAALNPVCNDTGNTGDCLKSNAGSCTCFCWNSWGHSSSLSKSFWIAPHLSDIWTVPLSRLQTWGGCTPSHYVTNKDIEEYQYRHLRMLATCYCIWEFKGIYWMYYLFPDNRSLCFSWQCLNTQEHISYLTTILHFPSFKHESRYFS